MAYKKKSAEEPKYKIEMPQVGVKPEVKPIEKVVEITKPGDEYRSWEKKAVKVEKHVPYHVLMWAGVKEVYSCTKCKWQEDKKDDAILHYLSHYPKEERNTILDRLVKEL